MDSPDELTLDLWLADALPSDEAAALAAHVRTCATCAAAEQGAQALDVKLHAALALDAEERAYLAGLELAAAWHTSPSTAALSWGWIAPAAVVAGFVASLGAAPTIGPAVAVAYQVGPVGVQPNTALQL